MIIIWKDNIGNIKHTDHIEFIPSKDWLAIRQMQLEGMFWKELKPEVIEDEQ